MCNNAMLYMDIRMLRFVDYMVYVIYSCVGRCRFNILHVGYRSCRLENVEENVEEDNPLPENEAGERRVRSMRD